MDSGFRRNDGWDAGIYATRGLTDIGDATWIPASAGMTGGTLASTQLAGLHWGRDVDSGFRRNDGWDAGIYATRGLTGGPTWIPASAGMTGGTLASTQPAGLQTLGMTHDFLHCIRGFRFRADLKSPVPGGP